MRSATLALLGLSIAAMWIAAIVLHPTLPASIPLHFNFSGTPDRWGPPSFGNWYLLPILGSALPIFLVGIGSLTEWLLNHCPSIVNLPRKEKLLLLSPAARERSLRPLTTMMYGVSIIIVGLFVYILVGTAKTALEAWTTLPIWPLFVAIPAILGLVLFMNLRLARAIDTEFAISRLDNL